MKKKLLSLLVFAASQTQAFTHEIPVNTSTANVLTMTNKSYNNGITTIYGFLLICKALSYVF